jgi:hypothetical protein
MKKIIQFTSFAFIAVILSVVSVSAQFTQKFKANVPFSFSIGSKVYDAGTYNVKITKSGGAAGILTVVSTDGKRLDVFPILFAGESSANQYSFLFDRSGDVRTLTKIITTNASYEIPHVNSKPRATLARKREQASDAN